MQSYLDKHRRQWNVRAVVFTIGALVTLKAVPTMAIVWCAAEKSCDLWVGGALVVFTNTMIWCSDRFDWLEWFRKILRHPLVRPGVILALIVGLTALGLHLCRIPPDR